MPISACPPFCRSIFSLWRVGLQPSNMGPFPYQAHLPLDNSDSGNPSTNRVPFRSLFQTDKRSHTNYFCGRKRPRIPVGTRLREGEATMYPYTVCLTSCARFDLLERTLESLLPRLEGPCERIIVGEDSGDREVFDVVERFQSDASPIQVILNRRRLGICRNIDRVYTEVDTDWIFHCEDDWEFFRGGFIRESFSVMQDDEISSVNLRDISVFPPGFWLPVGDNYYLTNMDVAGQYAGLCFNPGLRRMSDYRAIGPYGRLAPNSGERDVSIGYLSAGKRLAMLKYPAVQHIGAGRHVGRSRALADRISRKIEKRLHWIGIGPPPRPRWRR